MWLTELEAVSDPAAVPASLAAAVGIGEGASLGVGGATARPLLDKLIDYLREKELLIVLDNCEHLIETCAQVTERVLRSAPKVRILATSRERLDVGGEALLPVPPLGVPGAQDLTPEQLARSDAVQLFVDRATAVQPSFVIDAESGPAVGQICRRLDGIPLALELAAAGVRILPAPEIAARLDARFELLTSAKRTALPRHQTLRAAIDWSYELLPGPERELFGRLSVFAGLLRRRHAEYFLRLAERADPPLRGPQQAVWLRRLEADHANFSAAIDWAVRGDPELAVRLTSALAYFWLIGNVRGRLRLDERPRRTDGPGRRAPRRGAREVRTARRRVGRRTGHHVPRAGIDGHGPARTNTAPGPPEPGRLPGSWGPVGADDGAGASWPARSSPGRLRRCHHRVRGGPRRGPGPGATRRGSRGYPTR